MEHTGFYDVGRFHRKFGLPEATMPGPREVPGQLLEFRLAFLCEELQEILEACGLQFPTYKLIDLVKMGTVRENRAAELPVDHAKLFDGLIDLVYVAYGFAHIEGYPWVHGWERVQNSNMAKERATRAEQSDRGGTYDVVKPPGWTPPNIEEVLSMYGWPDPQLGDEARRMGAGY